MSAEEERWSDKEFDNEQLIKDGAFAGGWLVLTVMSLGGESARTQTYRLTECAEVDGRATFVAVDQDGDRYVLTEEVE